MSVDEVPFFAAWLNINHSDTMNSSQKRSRLRLG
jgi:hypothetical protein